MTDFGDRAASGGKSTDDERIEAKARLLCAVLPRDDKVQLLEVTDEAKAALTTAKTSRGEATSNNLVATSNTLADSTDCVNRFADWPVNYRMTP